MKVEIDNDSGFCFGVVTAIRKAEEELQKSGTLYCLGDIVHNSDEVQRLSSKGLKIITHSEMEKLSGVKVLLRAHGEPPSTYLTARRNGIEIIDATCPVVLKLQQRIKALYDNSEPDERPQIVIYGKVGHAEVNGLWDRQRRSDRRRKYQPAIPYRLLTRHCILFTDHNVAAGICRDGRRNQPQDNAGC